MSGYQWFDGFTIEDGHPSFRRDMTDPLNAQEFENSLIKTEYREGTISLSRGTIALQAHDPNSRIYFKNIEVRILD